MIFFHKSKKEASKKAVYNILDYDDNVVKSFENSDEFNNYVNKHYTLIQCVCNFEFAKDGLFFLRKDEYENGELVSFRGGYGEKFVKNELFEKYGFVDDNDERLFSLAKDFGFPAIQAKGWKYFVRKEDIAKIENITKNDYKPFALKGSDWPYWFKVNGKLIKSRTSSWKNYLYTQYNYVTEESLEEYNGPDKCKEHVNDSL